MPEESIIAKLRPGFPRVSEDEKSVRTSLEYIGTESVVYAAAPDRNDIWGLYPGYVKSVEWEPLDLTEYGILTVMVEQLFDQTFELATGTKQSTVYEIDWADNQKSLYDHPQFVAGGGFELTSKDVESLKKWQSDEGTAEMKSKYYYVSDQSGTGELVYDLLSDNAKMFARGIQLGIEYWVEKLPVLRRTETYVNGPPPTGEAGLKDDPGDFPGKPTGYEYLRSSDRSLKASNERKWNRDTEWLGAKTVLIDAAQIFWPPPPPPA